MPTINKIFIEIPTWLGDAIMTTPAVENIIKLYPDAKITMLGSAVSIKAFKGFKNIDNFLIDDSKNSGYRYLNLIKIAKKVKKVDLAISFRKSFSSKFMMLFINAKRKYQYKRLQKEQIHQVLRYNDFINYYLKSDLVAGDLKLCYKPTVFEKPTLGINPGATYGSAKRWYPQEFAKVAISLANKYNIIIFGGPNEIDIAKDIEKILVENHILNYQNLSGKTTVEELIENIAGLDLFLTNDSGPMHISAAYKIKTVAIFGPTRFIETSSWNNPNETLLRVDLPCSPCMKRVCPLKHHECMTKITANDVLKVL